LQESDKFGVLHMHPQTYRTVSNQQVQELQRQQVWRQQLQQQLNSVPTIPRLSLQQACRTLQVTCSRPFNSIAGTNRCSSSGCRHPKQTPMQALTSVVNSMGTDTIRQQHTPPPSSAAAAEYNTSACDVYRCVSWTNKLFGTTHGMTSDNPQTAKTCWHKDSTHQLRCSPQAK